MRKPGKKETLFCRYYVTCRNGREAAFKAGYTICPEAAAKKLLADRRILEEINKLSELCDETKNEVKAGLRRIAFASSADAVKLLLDETLTADDIEGLDLFNVAEIKKPKTGGIEIKFFDRIKALEKLGEVTADGNSNESFYEALERSAANHSEDDVS